jgi:hypothetical protein
VTFRKKINEQKRSFKGQRLFLYHGSFVSNWHFLLRSDIRNSSGPAGVFMTSNGNVAASFSCRPVSVSDQRLQLSKKLFAAMRCVRLCEVVPSANLRQKVSLGHDVSWLFSGRDVTLRALLVDKLSQPQWWAHEYRTPPNGIQEKAFA